MKKLILATSALVALIAVPAGAADMAVKYKPGPVVPRCANFGGWNVGVHAGWNYYNHDWKDRDNYGFNFTGQDHIGDGTEKKTGWHGGVQTGYNWQTNCTVFGVVADWSWTSTNAGSDFTDFPAFAGVVPGSADINSQLRWFGTVRAKTGVVVDNLLLYVTGGLAYARFNRDLTYTAAHLAAAPAITQIFSESRYRAGFAVGVGTEWAINDNWSINSEFLYLGFEKDEQTFACSIAATCPVAGVVGTPFRYTFNDSVWVSRISLDYRFNYAPVIAKY